MCLQILNGFHRRIVPLTLVSLARPLFSFAWGGEKRPGHLTKIFCGVQSTDFLGVDN